MAGSAAFARGEAYAAAGVVTLLGEDAGHLVAVVRGSEDYRVRLHGSGTRFGGDCTCPAYDRDGWCKHLVAAALAANAAPIEVPDYREPIRAHLLSLGATALADMLLDLGSKSGEAMRPISGSTPPTSRSATAAGSSAVP